MVSDFSSSSLSPQTLLLSSFFFLRRGLLPHRCNLLLLPLSRPPSPFPSAITHPLPPFPQQRITPFPLPLHRDTPFCRYVYFCLFFCFCCFGLYFAFFFFVSFCLIFWSLFSSRVLLLGRESIGDLSNSFIGRSSEDQILSSRSLFKSWH